MKRWKKFFALLLCVLLVLGLAAGCGRTGTESETASEEISLTVRDNDAGGGEAPQTENPPEEEEIQDTGPEEQAQAAPETANYTKNAYRRASCRTGTIVNAILIPWELPDGEPKGSFTRRTDGSIIPATIIKALSFCTERNEYGLQNRSDRDREPGRPA